MYTNYKYNISSSSFSGDMAEIGQVEFPRCVTILFAEYILAYFVQIFRFVFQTA